MSLIELGVSVAVGALVLGMVVQFFLSGFEVGQRRVVRCALQQTGMTALLGLMTDLQSANAGGLTFQVD